MAFLSALLYSNSKKIKDKKIEIEFENPKKFHLVKITFFLFLKSSKAIPLFSLSISIIITFILRNKMVYDHIKQVLINLNTYKNIKCIYTYINSNNVSILVLVLILLSYLQIKMNNSKCFLIIFYSIISFFYITAFIPNNYIENNLDLVYVFFGANIMAHTYLYSIILTGYYIIFFQVANLYEIFVTLKNFRREFLNDEKEIKTIAQNVLKENSCGLVNPNDLKAVKNYLLDFNHNKRNLIITNNKTNTIETLLIAEKQLKVAENLEIFHHNSYLIFKSLIITPILSCVSFFGINFLSNFIPFNFNFISFNFNLENSIFYILILIFALIVITQFYQLWMNKIQCLELKNYVEIVIKIIDCIRIVREQESQFKTRNKHSYRNILNKKF